MTPRQKTFAVAPCALLYLDCATTESEHIDWEEIAVDHALQTPPSAQGTRRNDGNKESRAQRRPIRRRRVGNVIRHMLKVR